MPDATASRMRTAPPRASRAHGRARCDCMVGAGTGGGGCTFRTSAFNPTQPPPVPGHLAP
eukprot:scaffold13601_cov90-Isochrysis_galbana.AAC.1